MTPRHLNHEELDIIRGSLQNGYMITHPYIKKMLDEIDRLHEIESHLCVVAIDGKFSHYLDDREPEQKAKFEAIVAKGFAKTKTRHCAGTSSTIGPWCDSCAEQMG